ncbi:hypothetical protein Hdeb2414_s0010g00332681 [Helianthus debilis subsp. tardiflorus]
MEETRQGITGSEQRTTLGLSIASPSTPLGSPQGDGPSPVAMWRLRGG